MNMRRVLLVTVIFMIAISSLSIVSAGWFDGLFESPQNNIVDIDDYQFNIPDGFELNENSDNYNYNTFWFLSSGGGYGFEVEIENGDLSKVPDGAAVFNTTSMNYVNSEGKNITISIFYPIGDKTYSDNDINSNKTINNIKGQFDENDGDVTFSFFKNESIIRITAPDEDLISNIIVN